MSVRGDILDLMKINCTKEKREDKGYIWEDRTFRSFEVTDCNRDAFQVARAVARQPDGKFNPLVICGDCGDGKTHLMNAIGLHLSQRDLYGVRWLSYDSFRDTGVLPPLAHGSLHCLLVDSVDAFGQVEESGRVIFLEAIDRIIAGGVQVVMTASVIPASLGKALPLWCKARVVNIAPPDDELRVMLAKRWLKQRKLPDSEEIVHFLVKSFKGSVRVLEGAIIRLSAWSDLEKRQPSLDMAKQVLRVFPAN